MSILIKLSCINIIYFSLEGGYGVSNNNTDSVVMMQSKQDIEHLKRRQDSVKTIQKSLEEVMGIFQRISTMVQLHEVMIERFEDRFPF